MNDYREPPPDQGANLPVDRIAEMALLGSIMLGGGSRLDDIDVQPLDFFCADTRRAFECMKATWDRGEPLDFVTVPPYDDDGSVRIVLNEAINTATSEYDADAYARRVRDLALKRRMLPTLGKATSMSVNGVGFEEVRDYLLDELDSDERRNAGSGWILRNAADLAEPPEAREWLLEGLIYRGQLSMWYGPPGIRKTLLLMSMCASMAMGRNWLIRRPLQPSHQSLVTFYATRPARILWLDYDNGEFETEIRVRAALVAQDGLEEAAFHYMSEAVPWLALDNPGHIRRLIALAASVAADVIVIDALGMVMGEVDENTPAAAKVVASLKELRAATGAAIVVIHHPSKAGAQTATANTYNASGSAKFSNFFEWTIELRAGEDKGSVVAEVVKNRGWAKVHKFAAEIDYEHFGEERPDLAHELRSFRFYPTMVLSAADKKAELIRGAVIDTLSDGEMNQANLVATVKGIVDANGPPVGEFTIRTLIQVMAKEGAILGHSTGLRRPTIYRLPASVDPVDRS